MKALVLAFAYKLNYHVLRLAAEAGYSVHVLGRDCAEGLKHSRFCDSFQNFNYTPMSQSIDAALAEIERAIASVSADIVLPSDIISTRMLSMLSDRLSKPVYPVPTPAVFDVMNNKWDFYLFCKRHDIPVPETMQFDNMAAFKKALADGVMKLPIIVKPIDSQAKNGIHPILTEKDLPILDTLSHSPVLMQQYIAGDWVGINILANHGRILAHTVQRNLDDRYVIGKHDKLLAGITRLLAASGYHGTANFDAMEDAKTGEIYFLECNPRFWYSIFVSAIAGINFVKEGLAIHSLDPTRPLSVPPIDVPRLKALIKNCLTSLRLNATETKTFEYFARDPLGALCYILPMYEDKRGQGPGSIEGQIAALAALRAETVR